MRVIFSDLDSNCDVKFLVDMQKKYPWLWFTVVFDGKEDHAYIESLRNNGLRLIAQFSGEIANSVLCDGSWSRVLNALGVYRDMFQAIEFSIADDLDAKQTRYYRGVLESGIFKDVIIQVRSSYYEWYKTLYTDLNITGILVSDDIDMVHVATSENGYMVSNLSDISYLVANRNVDNITVEYDWKAYHNYVSGAVYQGQLSSLCRGIDNAIARS